MRIYIYSNLVPSQANGTESAVIMSAFQQVLDSGDAYNMIEQIRYPTLGQNKKPLFLLLGDGDNVVPNNTALTIATVLDMPYVGKVSDITPMIGTRRQASYDTDGYGFSVYKSFVPQLTAAQLFNSYVSGGLAHVSILTPEGFAQQEDVMRRFIVK